MGFGKLSRTGIGHKWSIVNCELRIDNCLKLEIATNRFGSTPLLAIALSVS
ncbi:MAG: hypothetical protein KME17_20455 [Cyanosarcina radialis HA8281-LM2]|nr:hypothetical protein [Cyanosarcina radialis HA8281-LM2]